MFLLSLLCPKVHSTMTQTTGECEERLGTDTVALRLLYILGVATVGNVGPSSS